MISDFLFIAKIKAQLGNVVLWDCIYTGIWKFNYKNLWPHCVRADAARALALHPQLT